MNHVAIQRLAPPVLLALGLGCSELPDVKQGQAPAPGPAADPVAATPAGSPQLLPDGLRGRRRMDIDQLNASIRLVTGGIGWTEQQGATEVDLFVQLSRTLGKPDYLDLTSEDLTPSLLFQKFLDDAARSVCDRLIERELASLPQDRVLMVQAGPSDRIEDAPDAIEENLRALLLRYHGHALAAGANELGAWTWLFESAQHTSGDPVEAWRAVCVGLITHPDFYSY
jgi:hypothetical protein